MVACERRSFGVVGDRGRGEVRVRVITIVVVDVRESDAGVSPSGSQERLRAVEGLRAFAALCVFLTHAATVRYPPSSFADPNEGRVGAWFAGLTIGVQIFFAISGFVLLRPFIVAAVGGSRTAGIGSYLVRRMFRIYPAYWCALFGTVFVIRGTTALHGGWPWFANLALVQGYSNTARFRPQFVGMIQAWTLVVEVTFYVFLAVYIAVVAVVARRGDPLRTHAFGIGGVAALALSYQFWVHLGSPPLWANVLTPHLPFFLVGMVLAYFDVRRAHLGVVPKFFMVLARRASWCAGVALVAYAVMTELLVRNRDHWLLTLALQLIITSMLMACTVLRTSEPNWIQQALGSRVAVLLGALSYGIYLWHYAIIDWVVDHWVTSTGNFAVVAVIAVSLPVTLGFAALSWRVIEQPAIRLARVISRRTLTNDRIPRPRFGGK